MFNHTLSKIFLFILSFQFLLLIGLLLSHQLFFSYQKNILAKKQISRHFLLTDYCLTTESRHTRNISLPEPIAPFQDLPGYHEHFPSSSFFQVWINKKSNR